MICVSAGCISVMVMWRHHNKLRTVQQLGAVTPVSPVSHGPRLSESQLWIHYSRSELLGWSRRSFYRPTHSETTHVLRTAALARSTNTHTDSYSFSHHTHRDEAPALTHAASCLTYATNLRAFSHGAPYVQAQGKEKHKCHSGGGKG